VSGDVTRYQRVVLRWVVLRCTGYDDPAILVEMEPVTDNRVSVKIRTEGQSEYDIDSSVETHVAVKWAREVLAMLGED